MKIEYVNTDWRVGTHVSKQSTMVTTFVNGILHNKIPISAIQIFSSGPKNWKGPDINIEDLRKFRELIERHKEIYMCIHGCLLYNFAGKPKGLDDDGYADAIVRNLTSIMLELDFAVSLGRPSGVGVGVVVHPGSRINKDEGHKDVATNITVALKQITGEAVQLSKSMGISTEEFISRRKIILENSAGEGTKLCSDLQEIKMVIDDIPLPQRKQVKVCIDTAHAFGKGLYRWGLPSHVDKFYEDFDEIIGLEYLEVFHLNDSRKSDKKAYDAPFGSNKDRHETLSRGYIFSAPQCYPGLLHFLRKAKEYKIAVILETPEQYYEQDWELMKQLLKREKVPLVE